MDERKFTILSGILILVLALLVRLPNCWAALPYINYIDEGQILKPATYLLTSGHWDPLYYMYPSLPTYAVAATAVVYRLLFGDDTVLPGQESRFFLNLPYYDDVQPPWILVVGRLTTLFFSLGTIVTTGVLARHLAGPAMGLLAAFLAAIIPALVIRSSIVAVDIYAAFFVVAAFVFTVKALGTRRTYLHAALAGAMIGMAFTSKYQAVLVCVPVSILLVSGPGRWRSKVYMVLTAAGAAIVSAIVTMPALLLRTQNVMNAFDIQARIYSRLAEGSFWHQVARRAEWDLPLEYPELGLVYLGITAVALILCFADPRFRWVVVSWVVYGLILILMHERFAFKAFRNLLPLVPLSCVVVTLLFSKLRERVSKPLFADLAAILFFAALYVPPIQTYVAARLAVVDSRTEAVRWLAQNGSAQDTVVFLKELAMSPIETAPWGRRASFLEWPTAPSYIATPQIDFLVLCRLVDRDGRLLWDPRNDPVVSRHYRLRTEFGSVSTPRYPGDWRTNDQAIYIYENQIRS